MRYPILQRLSLLLFALLLVLTACGKAAASADSNNTVTDTLINKSEMTQIDTTSAKVRIQTTLGTFTVLLYGDTPRHRDNFLKLAREGFYDSTLFHRVISNFMIQTGDPDSKHAAPGQRLGAGDPGYTLEAEINFPRHFHKRGALAAARQGDQVNPQRRSSGSQFYVVTGEKVSPAQMAQLRTHLKNNQLQATFNGLAAAHFDEIRQLQMAGDNAGLETLRQRLIAETESIVAKHPMEITPEMEQAYTTVGGASHLDGQYTVFGEVIDGMDVIDKIEHVDTDAADRPLQDVRIISMTVLDD